MAEDKENRVSRIPTSIRLDRHLKKSVDDRIHELKYTENKTSLDAAIHEGLRLWLESATSDPLKSGIQNSGEKGVSNGAIREMITESDIERDLVLALFEILRTPDNEINASFVTGALEVGLEATRKQRAAGKTGATAKDSRPHRIPPRTLPP